MAPAAGNDLRRLTIPHQRRLRKPAGSGAREPFTAGLTGYFRPPLTAVARKPRKLGQEAGGKKLREAERAGGASMSTRRSFLRMR